MKVIFLDVDGVLNTSNTYKEINDEFQKSGYMKTPLDEFRVEILAQIIEKTNAKIVLTSSFRFGFKKNDGKLIPIRKETIELVKIFSKYHIDIYDITGIDENCIRQNEIKEWLFKRTDIENFVIIDDDIENLSCFINDSLIQTYFYEKDGIAGLSSCHIEKIVYMLNKNEKIYKKVK